MRRKQFEKAKTKKREIRLGTKFALFSGTYHFDFRMSTNLPDDEAILGTKRRRSISDASSCSSDSPSKAAASSVSDSPPKRPLTETEVAEILDSGLESEIREQACPPFSFRIPLRTMQFDSMCRQASASSKGNCARFL